MSSIGTSDRTLGKHVLLNKLLGREVGMLLYKPKFINSRYIMVDMCAGDGKKTYQSAECSPSIMTKHFSFLKRHNTTIDAELILVEKDRNTFDILSSCGYPATLHHCDAGTMACPPARYDEYSAAFIHIDPNHVNDWPLSDDFARNLPKYSTMLITLGCNVGGLKRLPMSARQAWFDKMDKVLDRLPSWHDALLVALKGDKAQWAYLITGPTKWHNEGRYMKDAASAFSYWKHGLEMVRYGTDPEGFFAVRDRLFFTKEEMPNG
jgi:hypothetical protein